MDNANPKQREMTGWYTEIRGALFGKNVPLSKEQFFQKGLLLLRNSLRDHESEDGKSN